MIKENLRRKLDALSLRLEEIDGLLATLDASRDRARHRSLAKERAELRPVAACFDDYRKNLAAMEMAKEMLEDEDPSIRQLAREEFDRTCAQAELLEGQLERLLLPRDPDDEKNIFLEVRAGTGGKEAALFAGDLVRMYCRYAEARGWRVEMVNEQITELNGYREAILRIFGKGTYSRLKFESGVHRVQRIPETEAQGRIHTSACTVAVLPEAEEVDHVEISSTDLRIDTFRASGAGGQHVNKTDSAIRITHLPSGIVVECQDDRSQHKNRAKAMAWLRARLLDAERQRQLAERAQHRRSMVGSGDRSERIRTYNFPQNRVTDHRIQLTLYQLEAILLGKLDILVDPLIREHQAKALAHVPSQDDEGNRPAAS